MIKLNKKLRFISFILLLVSIGLSVAYVFVRDMGEVPGVLFDNELIDFIARCVITFLPNICVLFYSFTMEKKIRESSASIQNVLGSNISQSFIVGGVGVIVYDNKYDVIWASELFSTRSIRILGVDISKKYPLLLDLIKGSKESVNITINECLYKVTCIPQLNSFIFKDINEITSLYKDRENSAPIILTILLDNRKEVESLLESNQFNSLDLQVRNAINEFANDNNLLSLKLNDERFIFFTTEQDYQRLLQDEFSIVKYISKFRSESGVLLTISLGIGRGINDYSKLYELSDEAISVAQSRGGSQTVVNNFGGHLEFFGGEGSENRVSKNVVKNRTQAEALYACLSKFKKVFIVPHLNADIDAIAAAIGVREICKQAGVESSYIVCEEKQVEVKTRNALKEIFRRESMLAVSVSEQKALSLLDEESFVLVVDVNNAAITTCPKLISQALNIGVIDHHKLGENAIENTIFSYIDTKSSSTCEIVTDLIQYCPSKVNPDYRIASCLYAGIVLDTNNFKSKSSASTFRTAMLLKESGAKEELSNMFFVQEYEEFKLKNEILATMNSPYTSIATAMSTDDIVDRTLLAEVSQEMLLVDGIKACFVFGYIADKVVNISARSDGSINVQILMEKLGGGGHHSMAACQIKGTLAQAKEKFDNVLKLYINEIR